MGHPETPQRSRVPWALALAVGLASGLAGYVIHAARVNRIPKQVVQVRRLTDMAGLEESPAISPDGKSVAFVAASVGRRQIWVLQISGGTPRAITTDDADHLGPRWSADSSSLIYFASGGIWETPAVGGEARKMADALAPGDLSHDGKTLAFFRLGDGAAELAVGARAIVKVHGDAPSNVRWSPDDKKIAYLQEMKLMVANLSGGEPVQAAGGDVPIQGFAWAPDNTGMIVSTRGELWFIPRVEGRSPSQLTFGELSYESPDIGPSGNLVVSRQGLYAANPESNIVMFSGLKW
jgi:dipeptidyl aminopeptidase/acylaminoacyl peptidase